MPLRECKKSHTHREFLAWMAWLAKGWEEPSRTEFYLIELLAEIRRSWVKNAKQVKAKEFQLKFARKASDKSEAESDEHIKQATKQAQAVWLARVSTPPRE